MRSTMIMLIAMLLAPSLALAAGGHAEDPGKEELVKRVGKYQLCFYKALPQAMVEQGSNTVDAALAERASILCGYELTSLQKFLAESWKDPGMAAIAVQEVRKTTKELALEEFAKAGEKYPQALRMMEENAKQEQAAGP